MLTEKPQTANNGYTADQNARLALAYKNKADSFENLNTALARQVKAQDELLAEYRKRQQ